MIATSSGSTLGWDVSIEMEGLLVERNMSASAMQLISVGWSEGLIPVLERMESPFFFVWLLLLSVSSLASLSFVVERYERVLFLEVKDIHADCDCLLRGL